jgi:hypothetical protein
VDVVRHGTVRDNVHQLHVQQLLTYEKPEAASAVLGSCVAKIMLNFIQIWNNKNLIHCYILLDFSL